MSLAFWKISRNGRWSSPRCSPPAAASSCSGEAAASVDRNGSPFGLNSGDGAPAADPAIRATRAEDGAPHLADRTRGFGENKGEAAGAGEGVGRRKERKEEAMVPGGGGARPRRASELGEWKVEASVWIIWSGSVPAAVCLLLGFYFEGGHVLDGPCGLER